MANTVAGFFAELNENPDKMAEYRADPESYLQDSDLNPDMVALIDRNDAQEIRAQIETDLDRSIDRIIIIWFNEE